jgi:23S rRNA (uracil1939-C5)-methyltransferase
VLNGNKLKNDTTEQVFLSHIKENHPQIITLALNENRENTNVVLGQHTRILFEIKPFEDTIFEVSYPLSVSSFFQVNLLQTETLYRTAFSLLPTKKMAYVVDLFCGVGSIGLSLIKLYPAQVG